MPVAPCKHFLYCVNNQNYWTVAVSNVFMSTRHCQSVQTTDFHSPLQEAVQINIRWKFPAWQLRKHLTMWKMLFPPAEYKDGEMTFKNPFTDRTTSQVKGTTRLFHVKTAKTASLILTSNQEQFVSHFCFCLLLQVVHAHFNCEQ